MGWEVEHLTRSFGKFVVVFTKDVSTPSEHHAAATRPVSDDELRDLLGTLSPSAREHLRGVLIHEQADRDAIASQLLRYRDERGDDWADIIDFLTMHPEARRRYVRLLGEIRAAATS